jgi:hypothetical protein
MIPEKDILKNIIFFKKTYVSALPNEDKNITIPTKNRREESI